MGRAVGQIPSISDRGLGGGGGRWGDGYILELHNRSNATFLCQMVHVGFVFSLAYLLAACKQCDVFSGCIA